jgi:hypothetical protein
VRIAAPRLDRLRAAAGRRQAALLGDGAVPRPRLSGLHQLVGRAVPAGARRRSTATAVIDDPVAFSAVRTRSAFLPLHVSGRVDGLRAGSVAIAVDGVVRAVTPLVRDGDGHAFSAMLPTSALRDGSNRVEVLAATRDDRGLRVTSLARTGGQEDGFAIRKGEIVGPKGARHRIAAGRIAGGVDRSEIADGNLTLSGWAVGTRPPGPVDQVLGFLDGRVVFFGPPRGPRSDIAQRHRVPPENLAFRFEVRADALRERPELYALRGGVASQLSWFCGGTQAIGC